MHLFIGKMTNNYILNTEVWSDSYFVIVFKSVFLHAFAFFHFTPNVI